MKSAVRSSFARDFDGTRQVPAKTAIVRIMHTNLKKNPAALANAFMNIPLYIKLHLISIYYVRNK